MIKETKIPPMAPVSEPHEARLLAVLLNDRTRGDGHKVKHKRFFADIR